MMNNMMKRILFFVFVLAGTLWMASCSENSDDPKYRSKMPEFSDLSIAAKDGGTLKAGSDVVATAIQSSKGRLLGTTTYEWSIEPLNDEANHRYRKSVIYDVQSENPVDTLCFPSAGTYEVKLVGKYGLSGQYDTYNSTVSLENGTKVTYRTLGQFTYQVELKKRISVK